MHIRCAFFVIYDGQDLVLILGSWTVFPHQVVGLVLLGIYILQVLLGIHIHMFKPKSFLRSIPASAVKGSNAVSAFTQSLMTSNRPFQNYLHAIVGIMIILIGFYNVSGDNQHCPIMFSGWSCLHRLHPFPPFTIHSQWLFSTGVHRPHV